jgi:alpha-glucosidase
VILDLVPNHTSDVHPWFVDARSSRDAEHRGWYVWRDPRPDGSPPNNWRSVFGGLAWELDEPTGQYYLHNFLVEQPDLDWWNEDVRREFEEILRFWFDRGSRVPRRRGERSHQGPRVARQTPLRRTTIPRTSAAAASARCTT